ncbi:glycosyltransferase, partial [Candidatus Parcubacteria bacterium]|nr:glycosyltransferase [Candidatus Parcubacteria bacterium]
MKLLIITQKVDSKDQLLGFFIGWLEKFSKEFEHISVLCLEKGQYDLPANVSVQSLGKDSGQAKIVQLTNFYRFIIGQRKQYDAVWVHMNPIWIVLGGPIWHILRKKVTMWYAHKSVTPKLKLATLFCDRIYTSTKDGFRLRSSKVNIVGQGIDTNKFAPSDVSSPNTILSVGRIAPVKNYESLIRAIALLKDQGKHFMLDVVGGPVWKEDFAYLESLKALIKELGIEDQVTFHGVIKNTELPSWYRTHRFYVNLSHTGSLDKTIVEAMASGCIVLSSNDSAAKFLPESLILKKED